MIALKRTTLYLALFIFLLIFTGCTKETVVLLPEEDGKVGSLVVGEDKNKVVLDSPMAAAKIRTTGSVREDAYTEEEVNRIFVNALEAQPPASVSFTLEFEKGSTRVVPESRKDLQDLFVLVAGRQAVEVQITGHTDTVGSEALNDKLSLERAEKIKGMLIDRGLQSTFIRAVGRGERELLAPTPDETPEPKNRRVEIIVR